jgi:hypothetical protein
MIYSHILSWVFMRNIPLLLYFFLFYNLKITLSLKTTLNLSFQTINFISFKSYQSYLYYYSFQSKYPNFKIKFHKDFPQQVNILN